MKHSTLPPKLLFDDLQDDGSDRFWSRTPDDVLTALGFDPMEDATEQERAEAVDPLLWLRPEAQAKWAPFVSDRVKKFWVIRAISDALGGD